MDEFDLSGKVAIVTGASRGIGEAITWTYLRAGADVVISGRKSENLNPVADAMDQAFPGRVVAVAAHAGHPETGNLLVETAVAHFGRLDVVVNNAGTNPHFGPLLSAETSHWQKILDVNLMGPFWLCQAGIRRFMKQGSGGKVINVASIAGLTPGAHLGVYSVSKAALIMFTRALAAEVSGENIQVNALAPGFVKTDFSAALWQNPTMAEQIVRDTPLRRVGEPHELSGLALYLAAPASDFTTGAVFVVDGGYTI